MKVFRYFLAVVTCFTTTTSASHSCGNEYYITPEIPFAKGKLVLKNILHAPDLSIRPYWDNGFAEDIYERYYTLKYKIDPIASDSSGNLEWAAIEKALANKTDYKLLSDYAWYELRLGSKEIAVQLLEKLYQQHPGEYNIIANLGTAYEVTGNNKKALEFLKKAVSLDPASHFGSEWIHINILEQKVKATPDYPAILSLHTGNDFNAWLNGSTYKKPITADSLMTQLAYQLHERISFIRPQDAVVGQLVLDFADLAALTKGKTEAADFYAYAVQYDSSLATAVKARNDGKIPERKPITQEEKSVAKKATTKWIYFAAGGVIVLLIIVMAARRKRVS